MMKKITLFFVMLLLSFTGYAQLEENFEGTTLPNTVTDDWVLTSGTWKVFDNGVGIAQSWGASTATLTSCNGRSAYLNRENVADGTFAEDWLVTPLVAVPTNGQLRFSTKQTLAPNNGSIYTIRVSTTSQTDPTSFTTIQTWDETDLNAVFDQCEEKVVSLSGYTGQIYIAFVMTNDNGDRWIVDDVKVVEQCLDPTAQTASNPTLTGATLGWTSPGSASQWEVEIVATGATPTGTGVVVTSNSYTATGLTDGTCYDFYVRALCTSGPIPTNSEWIGPFNFCTAAFGETCQSPIVVPNLSAGPYITTNNTSGFGDDVSGSPGSGCGTTQPYLNGDDVFYQFTSTTGNAVTITSQTTTTFSGLFVYSDCANVGVSCVAGTANGNPNTGTPDNLVFTPTIGVTYYIVISTSANPTPQSTDYTLTILENTCTNMTASYAVVSNCQNGDSFFVTADVTNMGTATSITGTTVPASPSQTITAPGVMQFGPFPNNTPVTINLQNDQDANCFRNSTALTQTFCPAPNNLCADAIALNCNTTVSGTTQGSTGVGAPTTTCGTASNTSPGVWYTFLGNGDVTTFSLCGSAFDTKMQILTGTCGAFTCVAGNDNSCGTQSEIQIATTVGTLYYIYVYGVNNTTSGTFVLNTTCITPPPPPANDNCDTATVAPVNTDGSCTQVTPGTVAGATPSSQANTCAGSADDDVWFSFTATQTTHTITLQNIVGSTLDLNHAVYSSTSTTDPCGNLTQVLCSNPNLSVLTGLTVGQVYFIRVYTATADLLQDTSFDLCVSILPPPPVNDSCANPITVPVNTSLACTNIVSGTISSATASPESNICGGTADDDVWFQFTAIANIHNVNLNNIQGTTTDLAYAVYSGTSCNALTQVVCQTNNSGIVGGLNVGDVYYIRVYSQPSTPNLLANFDICITTPTQCNNPQTTCGDGAIINNQVGLPSYGNIGCLFTTPNPFWFTIEIEQSGPITFTLSQTSTGNSDVDFILWGPFTSSQINDNTACNNLFDFPDGNTTIPNNIIDCSYSAAATEFIDIPNAIQGQHYILLVTNFGNSTGVFNMDQTSGTGLAACCSVELGSDVVLCNETAYTINATFTPQGGPDTISWYKDNVLIPNQVLGSLTVTETGIYKCEITCGQTIKTDEISVTFNSIIADDKEDVTTCNSYTLPSNLNVNNFYYTESGGPYGTGIMLNEGDVLNLSQTVYIFAATGTTPNCTDESSFEVTITPEPVLDPVNDVSACDSYTLQPLAVGNYYTQPGGVDPINIANPITTTQTVYVYAESGTAPYICTSEASFVVTINSIDADELADVSVCDNYTLPSLSANNSYYTQPGGPAGTGVMLNAGDIITMSQTIYIYAETNTTPNCTDETDFEVIITPTPQAPTVTGSSVCIGSDYTFGALSAGSYWSGPNGTGTEYSPDDIVEINATTTFYVYASNGNCSSETNFTVTAIDLPVVTLDGGCVNNVYTINATVSGSTSTTYSWTGPSGTLDQTGSSVTVNQDGAYTCVATTTLPNGDLCSSEAVVFAADGTLCTIQKGISPNGDGLNENFDLTGLNVRKLEIFNRYGKKVYSFSNYTNQWYGQTDNGNELPSGTYYYVIERDNVEAQSGWIYINR